MHGCVGGGPGRNAREIFAWTGNGAAPLPYAAAAASEPADYSEARARANAPGHIYGTTGFVSRPPDEDVVRILSHIFLG